MQPLAQPPRKDDNTFDDWMYRLWKRIASTAGLAWSLIDKTGSNITDIVTRNHADLQNINTTSYTHLTSAQAADVMYRAVYDIDLDGIVDNAESVNIHVRNSTGSTILKGSAVYISGATGQRPTITLAKADAEATSAKTIGLTSADILNNADGYAIIIGRLAELNTSAFVDGDSLWLSASVAGAITNTVPTQPNHAVFIGYCAYSQINHGIIVVNIQNGYELNELHNVLITTPTNGQTLVYDSATSLWKNSASSSGVLSNIISTPTTIAADTSYIVASYLQTDSDLTINGNLMVIG